MGAEPSLRLLFLGPPRLERDGRILTPETRKALALLARLALAGEPLPRDMLAAFLWPDSDEQRARAALRRSLSDLKSTVGDEALIISRESLGADRAAFWCDVLAFQAAIRLVEEHQHGEELCDGCRQGLETAVALYRDDFLAGFSLRDSYEFDEWQLQEAEYLRREFAAMLERLVRLNTAEGAFEKAIQLAQRWLALDPLREAAHRRLIELYAWTGQRAAALKQYRTCARVLEEELGVAPLAETTALYQAVLEDRLQPPPVPAPPAPPKAPAPRPAPRAAALPFAGREGELAALRAAYERVGPDGRFLALSGEAGIGKTRLAETFLEGLPDAAQLRARCYPGETNLTYAPVVAALRDGLRRPGAMERLAAVPPAALAEAARLLPEVAERFPELPEAPPLDWPGAQGRFFEGTGQALDALLGGARPGVLWLDDLQWADSASLELIAYLVRRLRERPFLLLACWRSGDLAGGGPLPGLLAETRREGGGELITLGRLDPETVAGLIAAAVGPRAAQRETLGARLYAETEGLPFLVAAYLQALPGGADGDAASWAMPPTVRDLFSSRLAAVGETERQIVQAAAIIGRPCRFELLQTVSGRSEEETVAAIEGAMARLLLVERPPDLDYDFSHHKLQEMVIEEMSLARRRLLHRRAAQALAAAQGGAEEAPPEYAALIAAHYQQAGLEREAAAYYFQAGAYARSLFAHREALDHFRAALALGHPDCVLLHEIVGDLHVRLGEYSAALNSFERAAGLCGGERLPRLEHKIGQVYYRRGEWAAAESHFRQAEAAAAGAEKAVEPALLYLDWAYAAYRAGDGERARLLARQAQALSDAAEVRAQVENMLGILERHAGELEAAIAHFEQSRELAREVDLLSMEITATNNLALAETADGRHDEALELLQTALEQCRRYGDRHWEAAIDNNLADLYHLRGDEERSMAHLKAAITILAEIGEEAGDWQPEIWKLSEW